MNLLFLSPTQVNFISLPSLPLFLQRASEPRLFMALFMACGSHAVCASCSSRSGQAPSQQSLGLFGLYFDCDQLSGLSLPLVLAVKN